MDKKLLSRIALLVGLGVASPSAMLAQAAGTISVQQAMQDAQFSAELAALWAFVQQQDDVAIYLAFLQACGDSPVCADFAEIARAIVVERTAGFTIPVRVFQLTLSGPGNRPGAVYVS